MSDDIPKVRYSHLYFSWAYLCIDMRASSPPGGSEYWLDTVPAHCSVGAVVPYTVRVSQCGVDVWLSVAAAVRPAMR